MGKKSAPRALSDNEAMAYAKQIRVSPQKLNLVAQSIRGKNCDTALAVLQFSQRRVSNDVKKLLESAIANAENNHQLDVDRLARESDGIVNDPERRSAPAIAVDDQRDTINGILLIQGNDLVGRVLGQITCDLSADEYIAPLGGR